MTCRISCRASVSLASFVGIVTLTTMLPAVEPNEKSAEREVEVKRADTHLRKCEMRLADDAQQAVERVNHALLVFGDPSRGNANGTLWAFGKSGRPAAFLELFQGVQRDSNWVHAVTLTGTRRVVMKTPSSGNWHPDSIQIQPVPMTDAFQPDEKEVVRLRQLKELARRFTAHEFWDPDNSRFELRLLVKPVHRYTDPAAKIHDAGVFALANGTNPEVLLLIEAIGNDLKSSRWQYSVTRLGSAEIHVELDGKEVWKRDRTPGVVGAPGDPYWLFMSPAKE